MCTLMWGKDTKKKTNNEEDVERVADEIPSELGGEGECLPFFALNVWQKFYGRLKTLW
eukprot:SAG11_NODE_2656_length_3121_cov_2.233212_4_plen_58_part_00